MSGINKVILIGYLGADPELRHTTGGNSVCELSLATNEKWTDKQGQRQERTEWHRVVAWGKLGENCAKHLAKGRQVYVEGKLQTRSWEDKEGNKRYTTEVIAQTVQFLGGRGEGSGRREQPSQQGYRGGGGGYGYGGGQYGGEPEGDIPF